MKQIAKSLLMVLVLAGWARAGDEMKPSKPAEQRPGCFAESVRISPDMKGRLPRAVALQFTVTAQGRIEDVQTSDAVDPAVATRLRNALAQCGWTPAADASGAPIAMRVELPIRFELERVASAGPVAVRTGSSMPADAR